MNKKSNFIVINEPFECGNCGFDNSPLSGGCRNHCVKCLYSLHVDKDLPGDRAADCHGLMRPVDIDKDGKKGYVIVHECEVCGKKMRNKVAEDDDFDEVIRISSNKL